MSPSDQKPRRLRARSRASRRSVEAWLFVAPALLVLAAGLVFPLLLSLGYSFFDWNVIRPYLSRGFVGLANYARLVRDPGVHNSLRISLTFTACTVAVEMVGGVALALLLDQKFRLRGLARSLVLIPMMTSPVVAALSWRLIYHADFGPLAYLLASLGLPQAIWLGPELALVSIIVVEIWQNTPFVSLLVLAGLQSIPHELVEAARIDGASPWRQFWDVTLPLLRPVLLVALIFRTMFTLREFSLPWVLTMGGPADRTMVLGIGIYRTAFRYYEIGYAAAFSWVLVALTFVITLFYMRLLTREALS